MDKLKVYWIGYGGGSKLAESLRPIIEELNMTLVTIHEWANANIKWNKDTWYQELSKADIIIIPVDYQTFPAKSNNRLTQALSMGKPVICSPLDAYWAVAEKYPGSFLFADSEEGWRENLKILRDSPEAREEMGKDALKAAQDFSLDEIGKKWVQVFEDHKYTVDIVIPTYNNAKGLPLCLESIRNCTPEPHTIYVVNNGDNAKINSYLEAQKDLIYIKTGRMTFAQAVNTGLKAGKGHYTLILNDDVIVSKGWLGELVRACKEGVGAVGCLSNCDKGWLHQYNLNIGGVELLPGINTIEQITPIIPQIYTFKSPYHETVPREWVAYYCTLIPRSVLDKVGLLCEEYINSGEDLDHCKRIRLSGYDIVQTYKSFVFHFGAVSRKGLEQENKDKYQAEDRRTQGIIRKIWAKKTVVLYSGPSWEKWDYRALETGIGGSEIWQIWLARELSNLGYRVVSFCDCLSECRDGEVEYLPYTMFPKFINEHWIDYLLLSRTVDPLDLPVRAGKVFVQIHDVFLLSDRNKTHLDKVTKFAALSDWHVNFASDYHQIPKDKFVLTANGIDFKRFENINVERNPYRLHWSSSWDRGLDNVLYLLPWIKERIPELELHVFYGIFNYKQACTRRNDKEGLKKIEELEKSMTQSGVFNHDRVNQRQLAEEMSKASLLLYPQHFEETFFITGVEAQYCGVPVLCNRYAGVKTTFNHPELGDTALMLGGDKWYSYTKEGREEFLKKTLSLLKNPEEWKHWSDKGRENAKRYSWAACALTWKTIFEE